MIGDIIKLGSVIEQLIPKEIKNIKVDFKVKELGLCFVCDDKNLGYFRVCVYDFDGQLVAYLEGSNHIKAMPKVGQNLNNYSNNFLFNAFHMCRCCREFERLGDINYSKGFQHFRKRMIKSYDY